MPQKSKTMIPESAAGAYKRLVGIRSMEYKDNMDKCANYFTDGCVYPWCDMCGRFKEKQEK